jgi:hypothetical protein
MDAMPRAMKTLSTRPETPVPYLFGSGVIGMDCPTWSPPCAGTGWGNVFGSGVIGMDCPTWSPPCAGAGWGNVFGSGVTGMDCPTWSPLCAGAGWESSKLAARTLRSTVPVFLARSAARPLAKATLYINSSDWL